ncbi:transposase [Geminisphaera colitermitum]|uniref:transposase n=1 Tax=Geminisphaera colitermitum TaxID=1148786 RepID=UPI0009DE344A|nr:transposase [Geminisphaera colitermitum]
MEEKARTAYNTNLADKEREILNAKLAQDPKKKPGRPAGIERREIINAILYRMNTGCQWRNLLHDFPEWTVVYKTYRRWIKSGAWTQDQGNRTSCGGGHAWFINGRSDSRLYSRSG